MDLLAYWQIQGDRSADVRWQLCRPLTLGDAAHLELTRRGVPARRPAQQPASVTARTKRRWTKQGRNAPAAVDWWFEAEAQ